MAGSHIASFHLVRERPGRAVVALARLGTDRPRLAGTPGLAFFRLLGTGRGRDTGFGVDPRRTALFAVWQDDAALEDFLARSPIARRWTDAAEAYTVRLRALGGHGTWRGYDVLAVMASAAGADAADAYALGADAGPGVPDAADAYALGADAGPGVPDAADACALRADGPGAGGPVAVVTRATVRVRRWCPFVAAGHRVSAEVADAPGLLAVVGIGEAPLGRQATFSLWRRGADATAFAYGSPHHMETVRRTRAERWYGEELFARFRPYAAHGSWDGRDPLS